MKRSELKLGETYAVIRGGEIVAGRVVDLRPLYAYPNNWAHGCVIETELEGTASLPYATTAPQFPDSKASLIAMKIEGRIEAVATRSIVSLWSDRAEAEEKHKRERALRDEERVRRHVLRQRMRAVARKARQANI